MPKTLLSPVLATAASVVAALVLGATPAAAQTAATPVSPAKKELVAKLMKLQGPQIESLSRQVVSQPALQLLQRAGGYVQAKVPADQREATFRELQNDARKYVDETYPLVRERALKLQPMTIGPVLEQQMTEEELRQVVSVLESPAWAKYQSLGDDMLKALGEKLVGEVKPLVEPRVRALDQTMAKRVGITPAPAAAASGVK
ncbi:MAG: hypothetical protein ABI696_08855 [Rubrivivax sp.]